MVKGKRKALSLLLLGSMLMTLVPSTVFANSTANVTYNGAIKGYDDNGVIEDSSIGLYSTTYGGGIAFGGENGKAAPIEGEKGTSAEFTLEQYENEALEKALYYGWGGPKQWDGFNTYAEKYTETGDATSAEEAAGVAEIQKIFVCLLQIARTARLTIS